MGNAHHHHCVADRRNRRGLLPASVAIRVRPQLGRHHRHHGQRSSRLALPAAEDKLTAARAYNKKLAESSQPILGEAVDPFAAAQGGSQASGEDSASKKDKEYQSLLNTGNGVMGTIKVPKQSINLPIYHGTSEEALASGAGHLYGTSLRWEVNPPIRSLPGTAGWLKR